MFIFQGLPQNDKPSDLRQICGSPSVCPQADQQYLLHVHLRDGKTQRNSRAARSAGQHNQWFCNSTERGAQDVPDASVAAPSQGQ